MKTFVILSRLLGYPGNELLENLEPMAETLRRENLLKPKVLKSLLGFMEKLGDTDLMTLQEHYVEMFDRGRAHSLHIFEHVHGESRFRGQAMVELAELYKEKGLAASSGELPDYLPLFLEFLSVCEPEEAKETLTACVHVVAAIGAKLKKKKSGYHTVFEAIAAMSGAKLDKAAIDKASQAAPPQDMDLEALDKEWAEPEAFGGADCGSCGVDLNNTLPPGMENPLNKLDPSALDPASSQTNGGAS